jgi:tetratricopeptide (TPR) repeat protein
MAPIACELCNSYLHSGKSSKTIDVAPRVLALLEQTHRERDFFGTRYNVYSGLCAHCVLAHGMLGNFEEGRDLFRKGLRFAKEVQTLYGLFFLELSLGMSCNFKGEGKNAADHLRESIGYCDEAQAVLGAGMAWAGLGYAYYLSGELETARGYIEKGLEIHSNSGVAFWLSQIHCFLSIVYFDLGDFGKARSLIDDALRLAKNNKEEHFAGYSRIWLGRILERVDKTRAGKGESDIIHGIGVLTKLKMKPFYAQGHLFLGELYADVAQEEKALQNLNKAEAMFQEMGMDYWLTKTQRVQEKL